MLPTLDVLEQARRLVPHVRMQAALHGCNGSGGEGRRRRLAQHWLPNEASSGEGQGRAARQTPPGGSPANARREALTATLRMSCIWEGDASLQVRRVDREEHGTATALAKLLHRTRQAGSPSLALAGSTAHVPEGRVEVRGD